MTLTAKLFLILGGFNAALAVMLGVWRACPQGARFYEMLVYQTGVQYHFYHASAWLIGLAITQLPESVPKWSGGLMLAGIVLFSGSLGLSLSELRWLARSRHSAVQRSRCLGVVVIAVIKALTGLTVAMAWSF